MNAQEEKEEAVYRFVARNYDRFRHAVLNEDYYAAQAMSLSHRDQRLQALGGVFAGLAAVTTTPALRLPDLVPAGLAAVASLIGFCFPSAACARRFEVPNGSMLVTLCCERNAKCC
jgi:hypothetical protein